MDVHPVTDIVHIPTKSFCLSQKKRSAQPCPSLKVTTYYFIQNDSSEGEKYLTSHMALFPPQELNLDREKGEEWNYACGGGAGVEETIRTQRGT